jgi:RNA polymerase sigma factor (sigma-70 family)
LVYFAALRQMSGDGNRAKDVAQIVFSDLARKAPSLTHRATLAGWLHTTTRFAASNLRRAEAARRHYEEEAAKMNLLLEPNERAAWEQLRPMIDDVVGELDERDREAVLLRYFENQPFAAIGAILRLSEDAARMRVERALSKLQVALARRGMTSTGAALAAIFANQVGATAPAGLVNAIASTALSGAASGHFVAATTLFMSKTATMMISAVALAAICSTFYHWNYSRHAEAEIAALIHDRDSVRAQLRTEQQRLARSAEDIAALQSEVGALKVRQATAVTDEKNTPQPPQPAGDLTLGMQRWEIQQQTLNNLRQIDAARKQFKITKGQQAGSIHELVGRGSYIKAVRTVDGEDYSKLSMDPDAPMTVTTPNGISVTFDPTGASTTRPDFPPEILRVYELAERIQPTINQALSAYREANNGKNPPNEQALVPFFPSPKEGADFVEYVEAKKAAGI